MMRITNLNNNSNNDNYTNSNNDANGKIKKIRDIITGTIFAQFRKFDILQLLRHLFQRARNNHEQEDELRPTYLTFCPTLMKMVNNVQAKETQIPFKNQIYRLTALVEKLP